MKNSSLTGSLNFASLSQGTPVVLLGVAYTHLKTTDGGDLYLTAYGASFWEHLRPDNWFNREWFEQKRERLVGTATVYKVPTQPVRDASLDLVVKWSRIGEDVPVDTVTLDQFVNAEFNSPFEEFSLVMEMRSGAYGPRQIRILAQKPLAIYVPAQRLQLWQTGRSEDKIAAKLRQHPSVELDILRQYIVIYGWIKGYDLVQAAARLALKTPKREVFLREHTDRVTGELEAKGYQVMDMKPAHVIVRFKPDGSLMKGRDGRVACALVDYELMTRTPDHEADVRIRHRRHYLQHITRRAPGAELPPIPSHLALVNLLGVDYLVGRAESTGGWLWVAGRDPELFDYFLPERWRRTPHIRLSCGSLIYCTRTKDNILLVWKVSRMGELPQRTDRSSLADTIRDHGYNSPFEEFAWTRELAAAGLPVVNPRAIYMTSQQASPRPETVDRRRYEQFQSLHTSENDPILRPDHEYLTIWGYWNGPDELFTSPSAPAHHPLNAEWALHRKLITETTLVELLDGTRRKLLAAGFLDGNLKPDHLLLSLTADKHLVADPSGLPEARLCNFELVRKNAPLGEFAIF